MSPWPASSRSALPALALMIKCLCLAQLMPSAISLIKFKSGKACLALLILSESCKKGWLSTRHMPVYLPDHAPFGVHINAGPIRAHRC